VRYDDLTDEQTYLHTRAADWVELQARREGRSRREILKLAAATVPGLAAAAIVAPKAAATIPERPKLGLATPEVDGSPIVKPLPAQWFIDYGTNAEMRWDTVDFGYLTPVERFFVRDHTATPLIDPKTWQLQIFGTGLRGAPPIEQARTLDYEHLLRFPHRTITTAMECAGNGRRYFGTQQGTPAPGTQWQLGAIGVAKWTGVPLSSLLEWAGVTRDAVDVMPAGLDAPVVSNGTDKGHVRRPFPIDKALDDVLVAYAMNGRPLLPDHGAPARIIVPGWVGVANIKWVGQIEVADQPLYSTWNTTQYRLIGPDYPPDAPPLTNQVVKSAFELGWNAELSAGRPVHLRGRSWSGLGAIACVEISADGGQRWQRAHLDGPNLANAWTRWHLPWRPDTAGPRVLLARATDTAGRTQPDTVPYNTGGYLFGAVAEHPVNVTPSTNCSPTQAPLGW
jgi:DMSO/TMAO reductase YedYZ molybdopterin-dependent catalytic subunit